MPTTPRKKTPTKNGAAPRRVPRAEAQKAIADMRERDRVADFRGVKFTLPPKLPATFIFDVGEMQAGDGTDFGAVHRLMVGLLGAEQWRNVRDKIAADGDAMDDMLSLMEELFDSVTKPYGVELGESEASVTS